jgi:hypothetical protein
MLVRNFGNGFGLPWQKAFQTTDKAVMKNIAVTLTLRLSGKTTTV